MIGRLMLKHDFGRMLAVPPCSHSAHFALHYLQARPSTPLKFVRKPEAGKLCTGDAPIGAVSVDNHPLGHWLGTVVPKRHARRSVTRNMLRRQVRAAMLRHENHLRHGLWLVRLRQPFATGTYASADSPALRHETASELDRLLARAVL
jgi:ribonuclease P protein component